MGEQERLRVRIKMCSLEHVKEARKDVKGCSACAWGEGGRALGVCLGLHLWVCVAGCSG